ncbi:MAG: hypothetical protein M1818_005809 [Claussenomyces sp. TS43310]|nr:MAG: hypothetical protein M1818_005809 [Claussenomyces sp. TS43310]
MAPWSSKEQPAQSHEQDLSDLLSEDERAELTLLIVKITEVMRKLIEDAFDASITSAKRPQQAININEKNPNVDDTATDEGSEEEKKARQLREKREKELSEPKQQELKRASLDHLQKWQESVIQRVSEVVNSKATTPKQQKKAVKESSTPDTAAPPAEKKVSADTNVEDADAALIHLYPPTSTSLLSLSKDKRVLVLNAILLLLLSLEHYGAHSRVLLLHVASSLHLPLHILAEEEVKIAKGLVEAAKHMSGEEEAKKRSEGSKNSRRWKVGIAGVAGAALIGVTGGLAAPLVAAGIGSVMGGLGLGATAAAGLLGTLAESGLVVGALFGAYGGRMTGKMMDEYAKEVEDFAFLPLRGSKKPSQGGKDVAPEDRRLRVSIGISGWLTQQEDIITPWRVLGHQSEVFALRWELAALMKLGTSLQSLVKSAAWGVAKKEIIARTVFASLMTALWPLSLLKLSAVVDNPFSVAKSRADKAGLVLADALINKAQGERPVTLVGYSLGARMVYSCLMSLAERHAFGLIESVVLIGAPAPSDASVWRAMRSVVAGRLVNVYSENDYILAFLYRTSSIQYGIAGLQEVQDVKGVENVNVSEMVSGHLRYQYLVGSILDKIGWEDIDLQEVAKEEETLALLEEEAKKEEGESKGEDPHGEHEAAKLEKEAQQKTDQSVMEKDTEKLHLG